MLSGIDFELASYGMAEGTITAFDGTPLDGARIEASSDGEEWTTIGWTTFSGGFVARLNNSLRSGPYYLRASHPDAIDTLYGGLVCQEFCDLSAATRIEIVDDASVTGIDIQLGRGGLLRGHILSSSIRPVLSG